jgi:hypothetical protein
MGKPRRSRPSYLTWTSCSYEWLIRLRQRFGTALPQVWTEGTWVGRNLLSRLELVETLKRGFATMTADIAGLSALERGKRLTLRNQKWRLEEDTALLKWNELRADDRLLPALLDLLLEQSTDRVVPYTAVDTARMQSLIEVATNRGQSPHPRVTCTRTAVLPASKATFVFNRKSNTQPLHRSSTSRKKGSRPTKRAHTTAGLDHKPSSGSSKTETGNSTQDQERLYET